MHTVDRVIRHLYLKAHLALCYPAVCCTYELISLTQSNPLDPCLGISDAPPYTFCHINCSATSTKYDYIIGMCDLQQFSSDFEL